MTRVHRRLQRQTVSKRVMQGMESSHGSAARLVSAWLGWYEGLERLRSIAAALRLRSNGRVSDLVRQCESMLLRNPELQMRVDHALAALA